MSPIMITGQNMAWIDLERLKSSGYACLGAARSPTCTQSSFSFWPSLHVALVFCLIRSHFLLRTRSPELAHQLLLFAYSFCSSCWLFLGLNNPSALIWCQLKSPWTVRCLALETASSTSSISGPCQLDLGSELSLQQQVEHQLLQTCRYSFGSSSWHWQQTLGWRAPRTFCAASQSSILPLALPCYIHVWLPDMPWAFHRPILWPSILEYEGWSDSDKADWASLILLCWNLLNLRASPASAQGCWCTICSRLWPVQHIQVRHGNLWGKYWRCRCSSSILEWL